MMGQGQGGMMGRPSRHDGPGQGGMMGRGGMMDQDGHD